MCPLFDAEPATHLCGKARAKKSQQEHAGHGKKLLRRAKRSCKNEIVVPVKKNMSL
jgi:hypothetical protein